jgi:prepilin-type N-terminal cleavage/methylation domain-containing protein
MSKSKHIGSRGFTIVELLIAMAIFLILSGAVMGGLSGLQKNYRNAEMRTTMQQRLRATLALMSQEIGQAGLQASTVEGDSAASTGGAPLYITQSVAAGYSGTVNVNQVTGVYVGQWLQVDGGTLQDPIQITAVNAASTPPTIRATFGKQHTYTALPGIPAYPLGVFPHGVLGDKSSATNLAIFGDINGSGNGLFAVEYKCVPASGSTPSSLTRTEWNLTSMTTPTTYSLIDNWTACSFTYGPTTPDTVTLPVPATYTFCPAGSPTGDCTYSMITQVGFTITTQETDTTSGTNQSISITKSYSNIQPRNIIAADNIYNAAKTTSLNATGSSASYANYLYDELQVDPTNLSSVIW